MAKSNNAIKNKNIFSKIKDGLMNFVYNVAGFFSGLMMSKEEKEIMKTEALNKIAYENKIKENKIKNMDIADIKDRAREIEKINYTTEEKFNEYIKLARQYNRTVDINLKDGQTLMFIPREIKGSTYVDIGIKNNTSNNLNYLLRYVTVGDNKVVGYNRDDLQRGIKLGENLEKRELERQSEQARLKKARKSEKNEIKEEIRIKEFNYQKMQRELMSEIPDRSILEIAHEFDKKYEIGDPYTLDFENFMEKQKSYLNDKQMLQIGIPSSKGFNMAFMIADGNGNGIFIYENEKISVEKNNMQKLYDIFKNSGCVSVMDIKTYRYKPAKILEEYKEKAIKQCAKDNESIIKVPVRDRDIWIHAYYTKPSISEIQSKAKESDRIIPLTLKVPFISVEGIPVQKLYVNPNGGLYYKCDANYKKMDDKYVKQIFNNDQIAWKMQLEYKDMGVTINSDPISYIKEQIFLNGIDADDKMYSQREKNEARKYNEQMKESKTIEEIINEASKSNIKETNVTKEEQEIKQDLEQYR